MPPKKAAAAATKGATAEDTTSKFTWTLENEKKLLLFMLNTTHFTQEDNERLATHAFKGSSHNSIRQRTSKLRQEQRALHEEHGWACPEGKTGATQKKGAVGAAVGGFKEKGKGKKRGAGDDGDGGEDGTARKKGKGGAGKKGVEEEEVPGNDLFGGVKKEEVPGDDLCGGVKKEEVEEE